MLERLPLAWKRRNQPALNKLLDINKCAKSASGAEQDNLPASIKELVTERDCRDHMLTLPIHSAAIHGARGTFAAFNGRSKISFGEVEITFQVSFP